MKKAKLFMMLALLVMGVSNVFAQNVTISPTSGKLVAALTGENEVGYENGWSAMWRHEQLPLTFTVSDEDGLTDGGEISNPAGNLIVYTKNATVGKKIVMAGGKPYDGYMVLSLPKGYHITAYKMVLLNNLNGTTVEGISSGTQNKVLYETNKNYNINNAYAQTQTMGGTNSDTQEFVIERNNIATNQLYFRLNHDHSNFFLLTIKSFEVWFTAEGTFEADINNNDGAGVARSVVTSPFKTSKIDVGAVERRTKNGKTYFAYSYQNVRDLDAYNFIYQEDAVIDEDGNPKHNGEPVEGDEVKTIYPVRVNNQNLLAFGNNTYYAESPVNVTTLSGLTAPVGYRIVGAVFTPLAGNKTSQGSVTVPAGGYRISFRSNNTTYYLKLNGSQVTWSTGNNNNVWIYDSETKGLYMGSGNNKRYLSCEGNGENRTLTTSGAAPSSESGDPGYFDLIVFEHDGNTYIGWDSETPEYRWYLRAWRETSGWGWSGTNYAYVSQNNTNNLVTIRYVDTQESVPLPDFDPGSYTLKVYGTDKDTPAQTVSVNGSANPITLNNLNNDAVKFEISGLADGKMALLSVDLKLQFLNPYIDKMNIVCHDPADQFTLTQTFTANDFAVAGGSFQFYVPEAKKDSLLTLTFSDLYSKYGDDTYDHVSNTNPGNSRYNFVKSQHNNVLLDQIYDATSEAASATTESERISSNQNVRTKVSTAGNIRFKFNNAEDLTNTQTNTGRKYLEEYPFTLANYIGSADPDGGDDTGDFVDCKLKASSETQKSGIYYVFTTDETRYNIAPTTAWQHRYYAFYRMDIELVAEDFTPSISQIQVYDKTYYRDANDARKYVPQYGVKLSTRENITIDDGNGGTKTSKGYLSSGQIGYQIKQLKQSNNIDPDQILYIDGSELLSIVEMGDTTISDLKSVLGQNALVFLPVNTTSTLDNFAFKTQSGTFRAGKDIVITDKQPFFSPYDIQVDPANFAMYDRKITTAQNGKVYNATVVLPFTIDLNDDDQHVNQVKDENGKTVGAPFSLYTMADGKELKKVKEFNNDVVQFFNIVKGKGEANTPYVLYVYGDGEDNDADHSFKVRCKGSLVVATADPNATGFDETKSGFFTNETASGTYDGASYSFKHTGTFRGMTFDNAGDPSTAQQIFYFAQDCFYTSKTLHKDESMYVQPFRSYYDYTGSGAGAKLTKFRMVFGDIDENDNSTNGIDEVKKNADLAVIPGKGSITLMAKVDKDVTIYAVSGITVDKCNLKAGDTRTVTVPAGIYVINGVKMIVK